VAENTFRKIIAKGVDSSKLDPPTAQDSPSALPPGTPGGGEAREPDYRSNESNPPEPPAPFKG
jgi:hypothetical protein